MPLKRLLPLAVMAICWIQSLPSTDAAELDISSETVVRTLEADTEKGDDRSVIPVYEYLGLDYGDAQEGGVSFHFYGWGRTDVADSAYFEDDPDAELIYGYVDYRKPYDTLRGRFGRQQVFAGVTNESVDGLLLEHGWKDYLSITLFGGLPGAYSETNGTDGDITYGGRLAYPFSSRMEVGLSYQKLEDNGDVAKDNFGLDLTMYTGRWLSLNGLSSYSLDGNGWREHRYNLSVIVDKLQIEPAYEYFQYEDYFGKADFRNNPFYFLEGSDETLSIYGADLIYNASPELQVGGRGRQYDYNLRNENARYMAGLLTYNIFGGSQIGAEAGSMDGQTPDNLYNLFRGYVYWQDPLQVSLLEFISADALFIAYDAPVYDKENSAQFALGAGRNFFDDLLETKLSVIYSNDPYFDDDLSGIVTMQIRY